MSNPNLNDYLTIKEAAEYLGVSPGTLRNWDRDGKIKPHRHPISGYRLFDKKALAEILQQVRTSARRPPGQSNRGR